MLSGAIPSSSRSENKDDTPNPNRIQTYYHTDLTFQPKPFQQHLNTTVIGRYLHYLPSVTSTMDVMMTLADQGAPTGTLLLAERQTQGRGRGENRVWLSPSRGNLYFNVLLRTHIMTELWKLNFAIPLAVVLVCEKQCKVPARVKWPNDVWVGSKKMAGMLINSSVVGTNFIVNAGIGINVNDELDEEMRGSATSVYLEAQARTGTTSCDSSSTSSSKLSLINREEFLARFCNELERLLSMPQEEVMELYKKYEMLVGKEVVVMPKKREDASSHYTATAIGYSEAGHLRVRIDKPESQKIAGWKQVEVADGETRAEAPEVELVSEEVSIRPYLENLKI